MKYRIDKVPPHPLHMGSLCNCAFREDIKEYFGENVLGAFRNTIFGIFLNLPRCNWIGQISKCLLMLEIQQENKDELHVWVQGEILKFTMLEFFIISGLKCTDNIDDYMYTSSSKSTLMSRRLNLSFSKDFEICDPTTYASISDSGKLKRTAVEIQQHVGTITKEFGDFSTISPQKILIKAGFESPISPDQPLKKRKIVMFEQKKQVVMDDDTSGSDHAVHHGSDLYRETHKDAADKGEIGVSKIQHHHHVEIGVSPQSHQYKSVSSSSIQPEDKIDEQQQSQEDRSNKQERQYKSDMQDVNTADKDTGREENFENEDYSDLPALEDEIMEYEEECSDEELGKKNIPDVEDLPNVNLTANEDVTEVNLKNQKSTDVTDVQVWELQASKEKAPAKRERKKSRVLRSPYISKYGSGFKNAVDIDKVEKLKYAFDGYNINQDFPNELVIDYSQWIAVGLLKTHSAKYTTTSCFFKTYVEKTHTRYYLAEPAVDLSTQQDYTKSIVVDKNEYAIANIIQRFGMPAGLTWSMVDEVYVSINYDNDFYDKTERTDWPSLDAYKGKITQQTGFVNEIPFDVDYVKNIPQQASDSLGCGVFVCVYAEILSEGLQVHSCGFDSACQRACYASLLWHYGVEKANKGYTSDNGDPPRPRKSVIEEIEVNAIVTLE
ncbi:hypothetical protein CQW23_12685 [Capsicum baccatum]|uniref:Ubiquitin-like protease family profile domain-containing protein n=1 Tax=Capsicum baccatum TaxID=33114 RepID=A0A2G2WTA9_CAPBA|nr:hypothetical protein CQW23_12685 [Capsicum baccatum]